MRHSSSCFTHVIQLIFNKNVRAFGPVSKTMNAFKFLSEKCNRILSIVRCKSVEIAAHPCMAPSSCFSSSSVQCAPSAHHSTPRCSIELCFSPINSPLIANYRPGVLMSRPEKRFLRWPRPIKLLWAER